MKELFQKIKAFFLAVIAFITGFLGSGDLNNKIKDPAVETGISDEQYFAEYFTPALRFAVASDVHIDDAYSEQEEARLAQLFTTAYAYSDSQEAYSKLDGVFFAGDISNTGSVSSLKKFFKIVNENKRENTTVRAVLGNHEFYQGGSDTVNRFLSVSGYSEEDADIVLGGIHFILLSPDKNGNGFSESKQNWLKNKLKAAAKEDKTGTKPIFVFQHHHVSGTVYGSEAWGVGDLKGVLEKYPQVVDFSGHSHYPVSDPRSIWQGSFTALGDGTLSYYEMGIAGVADSDIFPSDQKGGYAHSRCSRDAAQYYIVEVDKNNSVRILGYDILSNSFICEYDLRSVGNPDFFDYTQKRIENAPEPVFTKSAVITPVRVKEDTMILSVPQATGDIGAPVQHYRFEVYTENDEPVYTGYSLAGTYYYPTPKTVEHTVTGLIPGTAYKVFCTAVNCWQKESFSLQLKVKTTPETHESVQCYESAVTPDVFGLTVCEDGCAFNGVTGKKLTENGCLLPYEFSKSRYGLIFDQSSSLTDTAFSQNYDRLKDSFSLEFYGSVDDLDPDNKDFTDLFGNMQNGGFGLECTDNGKCKLFVHINGAYQEPYCTVSAGEVFHLVGTFNGHEIRIYKNGELAVCKQAEGSVTFPKDKTAQNLVVGGDSAVGGGVEAMFKGKVFAANIYSFALSADQIKALYNGFSA